LKVGVTLGDPAGIGPEIVAKSLRHFKGRRLVIIGNRDNFIEVCSMLDLAKSTIEAQTLVDVDGGKVDFGRVQKAAGKIALKSVEKSIELAKGGEIDALATAPINKEAILQAGSKYIDHTTMFAGLTNSGSISTVFEVNRLRIMFMTKHVSLAEACRSVTKRRVYDAIMEASRCLELLGVRGDRIAVAALNPHAGEAGLFGREEIERIAPAIDAAKRIVNVSGPYPADSVFHRAARGEFDIVVSLYHDQGHIAAKMLDFDRTVSLNIGLPFLRTSVDHGTAFDLAGKGVANETSMIEAIEKAFAYGSAYRERYEKSEQMGPSPNVGKIRTR
jgi:4-hydroxythreonine-4-phosphate dehydrogenase